MSRKVTLKIRRGKRSGKRRPATLTGAITAKASGCRTKQTVTVYRLVRKTRRAKAKRVKLIAVRTTSKGTFRKAVRHLPAGRYAASLRLTYVATAGACGAATSKTVR